MLHLSHCTIGKLSIGHIVNVASTDVQRFDLVSKSFKLLEQYKCINSVGISRLSFVVDISYIHASDNIFAMERTGPQLFDWCGSHRYSTTFSICHRTLAHQTVVCIYCIGNGNIIII